MTRKYFDYKTKLIGRTPNNNNILDADVVTVLKYFSNFWRSLDLSLITSKIELDFSWSKEFIISETSLKPRIAKTPNARTPVANGPARQIIGVTFQINNARYYILVVMLSINDDIKFLESMEQGFKRTISLNKYKSETTT